MSRETSIAVYQQIEAQGLLSKRRFEVYSYLFNNGPATQMETTKVLCKDGLITQHSYTPRFAELEKMGVIKIVGERTCTVTGRNVLSWDVTDSLPTEYERKPSLKKVLGFIKDKNLEEDLKTFLEGVDDGICA